LGFGEVAATELRDNTMADLWLYERLSVRPGHMSELGGPLPGRGCRKKLRGIVEDVGADRHWYFRDPSASGNTDGERTHQRDRVDGADNQ
jgi:hypothetical protein